MATMHERAVDDERDSPDRAPRDRTWSEETVGLRVRWNELLGAMDDARTAGVESWPEVRADLTRAFGEVQHALEVAVGRFHQIRAARADRRAPAPHPALVGGPSAVDVAPSAMAPSPVESAPMARTVPPEVADEVKLRSATDPEC